MHFLTWHGTIVCRADVSGALRHLPILKLPPGATPVRLDAAMLVPGRLLAHPDLGTVLVGRGTHGAALTLKRDGQFMCADMPSCRVAFNRAEASGWEDFVPVSQQDLDDLRHILQHHWIIRATRQVVRRGAVCLQAWTTLRIGTMAVSLADLSQPIVTARDTQGLPQRLCVPDGESRVELCIAGARGSEFVRAADGADAARRAAEAITLALYRNIAEQEPDQQSFEMHASLLERAGLVAGIETVLDRLIPPPPQPQPAAPVAETARGPVARMQNAYAQFGHERPARSADPSDPERNDDLFRAANASLRRFAAGAGLRSAVSFGTYDRAGAGPHVHGEVGLLDIGDGGLKFRVADDAPPPWLLMQRSLALLYLADTMLRSGLSARGRFMTELGDAGYLHSIAYCSSLGSACLVPDCDFIATGGYASVRALVSAKGVAWQDRAAKVFWRGSTTGRRRKPPPLPADQDDFTWLPRLDLCRRARDSALAAHYDVGISAISQIEEPLLVERIRQSGLLRPAVTREAFIGHKMLVVIDGNSNAWSALFCALLTGACVLLVASPGGHRQWYHDRLQPWLHFVPVSEDMRDLDRVVRWVLDNDGDARAIGQAGQDFADAMTFEQAVADGVARLGAWVAMPRG